MPKSLIYEEISSLTVRASDIKIGKYRFDSYLRVFKLYQFRRKPIQQQYYHERQTEVRHRRNHRRRDHWCPWHHPVEQDHEGPQGPQSRCHRAAGRTGEAGGTA